MNNNTTTNNNKRTKMKKIAVLLFVYLICHNGFYYVLMRNSDTLKFASDTAFRGFKCGADSVLFTITGSAVECAATCWNDLACSSMVRYPETHQCTGCTSFIGENDPEQSSSVFYKRGYNYIGCYKDCPRVMEKKDYIKMSGMTTEYCINRCLSKDFAYSNTEVGLECFCGSSIDFTAAQKMPEADCESECTRRCKSDMWGSLPWFALSDWSIVHIPAIITCKRSRNSLLIPGPISNSFSKPDINRHRLASCFHCTPKHREFHNTDIEVERHEDERMQEFHCVIN